MRIVSKFCMEEVFKCSDRRMIYWDEEWTKAQAWGCPMAPLEHSRSTNHQSLGMPPAPSYSLYGISILLSNTMFLFFHALCVILGASVVLVFSIVLLVLFCWIKEWTPAKFVLERDTLRYHCLEHSSFRFYYPASVLFF